MPLVYYAMSTLCCMLAMYYITLSTVSITHVLLLQGYYITYAMLYVYTEVEGYYSLDHG